MSIEELKTWIEKDVKSQERYLTNLRIELSEDPNRERDIAKAVLDNMKYMLSLVKKVEMP